MESVKKESKIRIFLKDKNRKQVMHDQHVRSKERQLISEADIFLWLSRGDPKGQTKS
jgi:hypothetical protein